MTINGYFDAVMVINLDRRTDKWAQCEQQLWHHKILATRFSGHDLAGDKHDGNTGCTASHRGVLELICHHGWKRTLILEDDFKILHDDFNERFSNAIAHVPEWDMLYLGGHYACKPQSRANEHFIKFERMLTTSSYAVTLEFARKVTPFICGMTAIDSLYFGWQPTSRCYIFTPRLIVQGPGFSDIQNRDMDNSHCMLDCSHEQMV